MLFFLKDEQFERTKYIQIIVCAAFIAGLLLSYPLWHSSRDYPSIPVLSGLYFSNSFFDNSLFTLVLGLLLWGCIRPLSSFNIILLNLISLFWVCQDQSRLQPWFVIYNFILFIIITARRNKFKDQISLAAVQLIVAAIYFWSGLQKFNTSFFLETYPWLVNPFLQIIPESLEGYFGLGALLVPFIEMGAGLALLFNWQRKKIVILLMLMHAFILTCLGPLGHNWNSVVWPWNLAMLILNFLLFYEEQNFPINDVFKKNYLAGFISVLFFGIAPFFSFFWLV